MACIALACFRLSAEESLDFAWGKCLYPFNAWTATVAAPGDVYAAGLLAGDLELGTNILKQTNGMMLLVKYDRGNNPVWACQAKSSPLVRSDFTAVTADSLGNIYVCGRVSQATNATVQTGSLSWVVNTNGTGERFIIKLAPDGTPVWARNTGELDNLTLKRITTDSSNNVIVTSSAWNTNRAFLIKLDTDGNELWRLKPQSGSPEMPSVAVDQAGNIYVAGHFTTSLTLGGYTVNSSSASGGFVAKIDPAGNVVWLRSAGSTPTVDISDIAVDGATNLLVSGSVQTTSTNLFSLGIPASPFTRPFVIKMTEVGDDLWIKVATVTGSHVSGPRIAVDAAGNAYVSGSFSETLNFGGFLLTAIGNNDVFVAKLDPEGKTLSTIRCGTPQTTPSIVESTYEIATGSDGILLLTYVPGFFGEFGSLSVTNPAGISFQFLGLLPYPAPGLSFSHTNSQLQLAWSTFPPSFQLETTTDLAIGWQTNTTLPSFVDGSNLLTVPLTETRQFFRLRKQ